MQQQATEQTRQKLNISLKTDGELNLSGSLENLSSDELILLQQLIDQSSTRSRAYQQVEQELKRAALFQGVMGAIAVFMVLVMGTYAGSSFVVNQFRQIQQEVRR
jgi:hypothetical protein